jgi:hypothetical protein
MPARRLWLLLLVTVVGCSANQATEIVVWVDSDLVVPTQIDGLGLWVDYLDDGDRVVDQQWSLDPDEPDHAHIPARLGLLPGEDRSRAFRVTVRGLKQAAPIVDRQASLTFVPDRILFLRMNLLQACLGVTCPAGQTCGEGGCEAVAKDPASLPDYSPELEQPELDAGPLPDAAPDAAPPDTVSPDTVSPDTVVPDTVVPDTVSPDTAVPDTVVPDTAVPDGGGGD